ncbi:hypothetical protein RJ639_014950 [Escallonia herrerae]|uniref:Uncharacterized protein n=1 Tax=Escallonia herrerae TaxID=1293975 RepID=A0AA89ALA0_9ASTE|nr:hypothetical protein RJ639_014950 [Escallonia herrerae]
MASSTESNHRHHCNPITRFIQSASTNLSSLLIPKTPPFPLLPTNPPSKVFTPLSSPPLNNLTTTPAESAQGDSSFARAAKNMPPDSGPGFRSTVRVSSLNSAGKSGGGPAFVGQVFSMCDLSGTGLMAVSTHFDIPFISKSLTQLRTTTVVNVARAQHQTILLV